MHVRRVHATNTFVESIERRVWFRSRAHTHRSPPPKAHTKRQLTSFEHLPITTRLLELRSMMRRRAMVRVEKGTSSPDRQPVACPTLQIHTMCIANRGTSKNQLHSPHIHIGCVAARPYAAALACMHACESEKHCARRGIPETGPQRFPR
jgi:hypothetical protein